MVKRRVEDPVSAKRSALDEAAIERYASGADSYKPATLNPNAKRDYKALMHRMNEYEYQVLEQLAKKTDRSMLSLLRLGVRKLAEEEGIEL